jgi:hypothetical protein
MRSFLLYPFIALFLLVACGQKKVVVSYGVTTAYELKEQVGSPIREETIPVKEGKVLHYAGDTRYQTQEGIVTARFRSPTEEEKLVLFWKNRFKSCPTLLREISSLECELACPEQGISVVYSQDSEFVSRVVEYAKN